MARPVLGSVYRSAPYRAVLCWAALYRLVSYRRIPALRAPKLGSLQCLPAWENATSTWARPGCAFCSGRLCVGNLDPGNVYMYSICTLKPSLCTWNCRRQKMKT